MLVGWVPISNCLNVVERTARRWADLPEDPLPVFNFNVTQVAAWGEELKAWQSRHEERSHGRRKPRASITRTAA
jgi:hypothetical protein